MCREGQQTCGGPGLGEGRGVAAASRGVSFWGDEVLWNWTVVKVVQLGEHT